MTHTRRILRLANCCFAHNSLGFPVLLRFCDARSGRSFHPLHRYPGSLARTWRRSFHRCGVASPQAPTPDPESLQAPIAETMRVGPHPRRFDGAVRTKKSMLIEGVELANSSDPECTSRHKFCPASTVFIECLECMRFCTAGLLNRRTPAFSVLRYAVF